MSHFLFSQVLLLDLYFTTVIYNYICSRKTKFKQSFIWPNKSFYKYAVGGSKEKQEYYKLDTIEIEMHESAVLMRKRERKKENWFSRKESRDEIATDTINHVIIIVNYK